MAQTLETIRLLRIRAVAEGLEQAARQQSALADAMQGVVRASDELTRSTDQSANKTLSGLKAWEQYQRSTDGVYRSIEKADRAIKTLMTSFEQKRMSAERFREELEGVWRSLDQAGVPRNFADLNFETVRKQAQETLRLREMEREIAREVNAIGVQREQRRLELQTRANQILERTQPMLQAQLRYQSELKEIEEMRVLGLLRGQQVADAQADALRRLNVIQQAHSIGGQRLTRAEMTNVAYQMNDIVTMLASGSNPLQILATQGPQLYQILQGSRGGLVGGLRDMGTMLVRMLPSVGVFGSLAAGAALAATGVYRVVTGTKELEGSLTGIGRGTRATVEQLEAIAQAAAGQGGMSDGQARGFVAGYARTGKIAIDVMQELTAVTKDFAATVGKEADDAAGELARMFADPATGATELAKQLGTLDSFQVRNIQLMALAGRTGDAQRAMLESMNGSLRSHAESLTLVGRAWEAIKNTASNAVEVVGRTFVGTEMDAITRLRAQTDALRAEAERIQNLNSGQGQRDQGRWFQPKRLLGQDFDSAEEQRNAANQQNLDALRRAMEAENAEGLRLRAESDRRVREQQEQAARSWRDGMFDALRDLSQYNTKIEDLQALLDRIDATDAFRRLITPEDIARAERLRGALGAQMSEARAIRAAGGQIPYEAQREGRFNLSTAGIEETARALAELNKRFDEMALAAAKAGESVAGVEAARQMEIEAFQRNQAMSLARSVMPDLFALGDLQIQLERLEDLRGQLKALGLTAEQIEALIGRARQAVENYRTPMQRMAEDFALTQKEIAAVTFEQKAAVEAERARLEALRAGRTELEAAAAAEMARANALARSQRMGWEQLRGARDEASLVGMRSFQREQAEIGQRYGRMREQEGDSQYLREAEALERWRAAQEAIRGPLQDANDELDDQIRLTRMQAATFGASVEEIEAAAEAQRLMNEYMRMGVQITPELAAAIEDYARRAGQLKGVQHTLREQQQTLDDIKGMGRDALKGFLSDLKEGKSAGEAFLNVLERILDRILDMMLDSLFDPNSQRGFNIFSVLFGGGRSAMPPVNVNPFSSAPSMTAPPASLSSPMPTLTGGYASPAINQAISGSLIPTFKQATQAVSGLGAASGSVTGAFDTLNTNMEAAARAIRTIESGSPEGNYGALGKVIKDPNSAYFGDRAYGAYQVMGKNVPAWTEKWYGERLDPQQFLQNPVAQDMVFQGEFGSYMNQYGPEGAARMWYGGPRALRDFQRSDITSGGQTTGQYGSRFGQLYQEYGGQLNQLGEGVNNAATSFESLNPSLSQFGQGFDQITGTITQGVPQLQNNFSQLPSMIGQGGQMTGQALENTAGVIGQGADGIGSAISQLGRALSSGGGGGGGLGNLFGGLFGGGGGWDFWSNNMDTWTLPTDFSMSFFHSGGKVGGGGGRRARMTVGDYFNFLSAPRFHKGSLKPDEKYAIVQNEEVILSRQDTRQARERGGKMGQQPMVLQPVVNLVNPPSEPSETRTNQDGSVDIIFEQMEGRMADRAKRGRGPLVKAIGSRREGNALIG